MSPPTSSLRTLRPHSKKLSARFSNLADERLRKNQAHLARRLYTYRWDGDWQMARRMWEWYQPDELRAEAKIVSRVRMRSRARYAKNRRNWDFLLDQAEDVL